MSAPDRAVVSIRRGEIEDALPIARVQVESSRSTYAGIFTDAYLASLSTDDRKRVWSSLLVEPAQVTLVATVDAEVVGFANGGPNRGDEPFTAELYAIYLLERHQRIGLGRRLAAALSAELSDRGHDSMIVWVLRDNPFRRFYEALGASSFSEKLITAGGRQLAEVSYVWRRFPLHNAD